MSLWIHRDTPGLRLMGGVPSSGARCSSFDRAHKAWLGLGAGLLLLIAIWALAAKAAFIHAPTYAAGHWSNSVAVGDFNGDGILDLVVANQGGAVNILLGNGDGTFQPAQVYAPGVAAFSVTVADFNGDGHLDIAVAVRISNEADAVSILLGNGDGTFQASRSYAVGSGAGAIAVGDFNGDGVKDLAVTNGNSISILLGNGDGTFQAYQPYPVPGQPLFLAVGEFNADGHPDLVATHVGPGSLSILLGNGDGTFQAVQEIYLGFYPNTVAVGDFNEDGIPDLAVDHTDTSSVALLLGNGDGTFQVARDNLAGYFPAFLAVGDFNGDGHLDLAGVSLGSSTVSILLGNGDGTFQTSPVGYVVGPLAASLAVGDLDGDHRLDLAVANLGAGPSYEGTVSILRGKGDGTFQTATLSYPAGPYPGSVAVGDFNADGAQDCAVCNPYSNTVSVLLGNGDGTFQAPHDFGVGTFPTSLAVGDFNGDGIPDLVVANSHSNTVSVLLGNGDGTFQPAGDYDAGSFPYSLAVGDFNGDGILDLAVSNPGTDPQPTSKGTVSILLGNGNGRFLAPQSYTVGHDPTSVAVGDFDGDGHLDLAVANYGPGTGVVSTVSVLLGKGDGTFQAAGKVAAGYGPLSVAVGDFNGDGIADIVTTNFLYSRFGTVESDLRVFMGKGDGTFQAAGVYSVSGPVFTLVGDFNGDGIPDLAVASGTGAASTTVSVLLGKGDGTFASALTYSSGGRFTSSVGFPSCIALGDFNGDGYPDVVVANGYGSGLAVLLNDTHW